MMTSAETTTVVATTRSNVENLSPSSGSPSTPTNTVNMTHTTTMGSMYATLVGGNTILNDVDDSVMTPSGDSSDSTNNNSNSRGTAATSSKPFGEEEYPYSIRLTPFVDHSSNMPSLYLQAVERKAKESPFSIKIGRYPDKMDDTKLSEEISPIVFKSKVVSRSHAEFFVENGQWYIKDIKSSSGTFLNHIRLAPASTLSEPYPLNDGDTLQLGMDFRGGSEEIYKCIKVRVELNRSWDRKPNHYNINALTNLRNIFATQTTASSSSSDGKPSTAHELQECTICLLPVQACQSLFIAPCSHGWHYKCIRPVIVKSYPHFHCPNCRSICDLEAEIITSDISEEDMTAAMSALNIAETKNISNSPD
jgi:pSer/pThr/pTyr-binding forkhead associated (FHA) protein